MLGVSRARPWIALNLARCRFFSLRVEAPLSESSRSPILEYDRFFPSIGALCRRKASPCWFLIQEFELLSPPLFDLSIWHYRHSFLLVILSSMRLLKSQQYNPALWRWTPLAESSLRQRLVGRPTAWTPQCRYSSASIQHMPLLTFLSWYRPVQTYSIIVTHIDTRDCDG